MTEQEYKDAIERAVRLVGRIRLGLEPFQRKALSEDADWQFFLIEFDRLWIDGGRK